MSRYFKFIYLIFILSLILSCTAKKPADNIVKQPKSLHSSLTDSLNFISGIRSIFQDSKANYWFGSHNEGLCYYNGNTFQYFTTANGLQDNQIRSIHEDQNGIIWITTSRGVNSYDGIKFTPYSTAFNAPELDWNTTTGDLWFYAGEEDGINRFDGFKMNYLLFPKPTHIDAKNSFGVTDISKDKQGRVWIATYAALFSYDGEHVDIFGHDKLNLKDNEKIHIRSLLVDSKDQIWIGNNGIGVVLKTKETITHFSKDHAKLIPIKEFETNLKTGQLSKNTGLQSVFAIEEDSKGNIWFGDRDSGAWRYDGTTLKNYPITKNDLKTMIWCIYKDRTDNLLFGMSDGNVYQFNGKSFDKMF